MSLAAKQALVCWFAALALIVAALFAFAGAPGSPDGAGEAMGRVFAHTGIAALICWMLARRKTPPWSWVRFVLVYVVLVVVLAIVANAGRAHAAQAQWSDAISVGFSWDPQSQPPSTPDQPQAAPSAPPRHP
jgi:peptidoglycan biosynthesis protein MviN/MurJ (putative lipid II flippase)